MTVSEERRAAIRARLTASTPGPWTFDDTTDSRGFKGEFRARSPFNGFMLIGAWCNQADVDMMVHAPEDINALLVALEAAEARATAAEQDRDETARFLNYSNKAREIMRAEKEHGWREAERWEDRADRFKAERDALQAQKDAALALADRWPAETQDGKGVKRDHWRGDDYVDGQDQAAEQCATALRAALEELVADAAPQPER